MTAIRTIELTGFRCHDVESNASRPSKWSEYSNYKKDERAELYRSKVRDIITTEDFWDGTPLNDIGKIWFNWDINVDRIHGYHHDDELQALVVLAFTRSLTTVEVQLLTPAAYPVVTYYFHSEGIDVRDLTPADLERCVKKAYKLYAETDLSFPAADEENEGE